MMNEGRDLADLRRISPNMGARRSYQQCWWPCEGVTRETWRRNYEIQGQGNYLIVIYEGILRLNNKYPKPGSRHCERVR